MAVLVEPETISGLQRQENRHDEESQGWGANKQSNGGAQRTLWLAAVIRESLYEFVIREGMKALDTMLEHDRERICGLAHAKGDDGNAVRWGSTDGRLVMAGRRVSCESLVLDATGRK